MKQKALDTKLARLEYLANRAKKYADNACEAGIHSTTIYWDGVEAAYKTAIQIIQGNDPYC